MTGLDTNVLIRYMVQDDPTQSARAIDLIERQCTADAPGFINRIVLCEIAWVLQSVYRRRHAEIAGAVEKILSIDRFRVEDLEQAWRALHAYRSGKADFADYLLGLTNHRSGCRRTATFDRALAGEDAFSLLV